jgi:hypothetical protein
VMLLLLAAVAVGAFWAGKQSRSYPHADVTRPPAARTTARDEIAHDSATLVWPWVVGAVILGVLVLGMASGPTGMSGGPGLFGGPGGLFAGLMGP